MRILLALIMTATLAIPSTAKEKKMTPNQTQTPAEILGQSSRSSNASNKGLSLSKNTSVKRRSLRGHSQ
jgi:hypothetical protein